MTEVNMVPLNPYLIIKLYFKKTSYKSLSSSTHWIWNFVPKLYVEPHNSGQVGCLEIVPYCGGFPYFASSLFTNGHFGQSGVVPYFASFPYFASPFCECVLYLQIIQKPLTGTYAIEDLCNHFLKFWIVTYFCK
jgi:hypothetical protein